jgi:acid phosphatase family membrane protein YuiD
MGKIEIKKKELKKRVSYITIEALKGIMLGALIALIGTPLMWKLMDWFLLYFFGYTLW